MPARYDLLRVGSRRLRSMLLSAVLSNFAQQAKSCDDLGSPFTARLCRLLPGMLDVKTATGRRVLDWPGDPLADALALRLCGGLHALVLAKADAELLAAYPPNDVDDEALGKALAGAIRRNDPFLATSSIRRRRPTRRHGQECCCPASC